MSSHVDFTNRRRVTVVALSLVALAAATGCHRRESTSSLRPATTLAAHATMQVTRVEQLLEGRFPGVSVLRGPSGSYSVRIRGVSRFSDDREPLYVVDGMPVEVVSGRGLDWLPPEQVARIDVLKDAAQTALFGTRGANGVIVITTKKGR